MDFKGVGLKRLNIGCGTDIRDGWINLDKAKIPGVDIVHDLESLPLPFEDSMFDQVLAKDVFEHLDYIQLLQELHRILKAGGELTIQVPHFTSADNFTDPTHKRRFSIRTFNFFISNNEFNRSYYFDFSFSSVKDKKITFLEYPLIYNLLIKKIVNFNDKTKKYYELTGLSSLFPAKNIVITLVK